MEDDRIIELYWERKEEAIEETSQKYGRYCKSIALRILENMECCEECVNDTWFNAWNAIPPQRPTTLRIFLGRITRNLALNRVRDLSCEKRGGGQAVLVLDELTDCIPVSPSPEKVLEDKEITASIERWLETLSKEKRVAFIRRYWYCDNLADVASFMGWSESKTNSLIQRLRINLKHHLLKEGITL
ncbi:RNA polymerase sigma factor [Anaerosporobacter sp.]|uniref:RNA polymerase sigma factor n=1 Tax=Anaerosporobacter sp. TaxID=1872529 RepID=UPI00286F907B|nr:RNA polymerase sigma factor [Anaerosporobacter sp.]